MYPYKLVYCEVRPDFIDVLFLISFADPFHNVHRFEKNKNKRKNRQKIA